jgi:integrase
MSSKKRSWTGRVFIGRDQNGKQQYHWVGRFPTKRERDDAIARARIEKPWEQRPPDPTAITCEQLAARYLRRYEEFVDRGERKSSSFDTVERELRKFRSLYGDQPVVSVTPILAEDWALTVPRSSLPRIRAVFHYGTRLEVIHRNPFDGVGGPRSRGRSDENPPTLKELQQLLDACDVLGAYAPQLRDLIEFAAYTLMRPGELYELRYPDIDLAHNRIHCHRRVFRGHIDTPKTGKKTIALVPPARAILLRQPTRIRDDGLVFTTKTGKRLATSTMSGYWAQVKARAGLNCDFYLATKHYGVHQLYKLGLSRRAIAAQAGWSERDVDRMLAVYGHADLVALAEVDALYADERDANGTHDTPETPVDTGD